MEYDHNTGFLVPAGQGERWSSGAGDQDGGTDGDRDGRRESPRASLNPNHPSSRQESVQFYLVFKTLSTLYLLLL